MKKTLQQGLLAALIISITACGGGGGGSTKESSSASSTAVSSSSVSSSSSSIVQSSSSSVVQNSSSVSSSVTSSSSSSVAIVSTTYTVSISAPVINEVAQNNLSNFFIRSAMAADAPPLTGENFAVIIVDLAGNVLERIELDDNDVTQNEDGTYSINVPGNPRLDCLIVTNLNNPIVLPDVANINSLTDLLFAPTTDENVDIDVGSTAAYVNLLNELGGEGGFNDIDLDVNDPDDLALIESIINNVQEVINNQVVTGYDTIAEAIAAIQEAVIAIVEQEALNVTNPAPEEVTLASTINAGGVYWYEASDEEYIEYGEITADAPESIYRFNGSAFELYVGEENDRDLRLVDGQWTVVADRIEVASLNEDGSAVMRNVGANDDQFLVESTLEFSLTGRTIADYLYATFDTRALAEFINPDATFSAGAVGLRLNVTSLSDTYRLWYETGAEDGTCPWDSNKNANDFGGNCETLSTYFWQANQESGYYEYDQATETLAGILSTDVAVNSTGSKMVSVNWTGDNQSINVQLINNEAKTARYYIMTWGNNGNQLSNAIGEGTWSYISLPGVTGDAAQAIRVDVPAAVQTYGDFDDDQGSYIMTVNSGFVRLGNFEEGGKVVETDFTLLNGTASDDILGAIVVPEPIDSRICFDASSTTDNGDASTSGWTQANLHYWSPTPSDALTPVGTEWPGFAMAQNGSFYCYDFSELLTASAMPTTLNVIFNNVGQSAAQTANLTFTAANGACYQNNAWTTLEACGVDSQP